MLIYHDNYSLVVFMYRLHVAFVLIIHCTLRFCVGVLLLKGNAIQLHLTYILTTYFSLVVSVRA